MFLEWRVGELRVTAFPSDVFGTDVPGWFETVVGQEPTRQTLTKRVVPTLEAEGATEEGNELVRLHVEPAKLDWRIAAVEPGPSAGVPAPWPTIGTLGDTLQRFGHQLRERWLPIAPDLNRLAVGAILITPTRDRGEAYGVMQRLLPFRVEEGSSDFTLQINLPTEKTIDAIGTVRFNRLVKVAALVQTGMFVSANVSQAMPPVLTPFQESYACVVEIDVNTSAERRQAFAPTELGAVYDELLSVTRDLAERGIREWFKM